MQKDELIKTLTTENLVLRQVRIQLENQCSVKDDQQIKISALAREVEELKELKTDLQKNFEDTTNYLLDVEEKCQEAQNHCLNLLQHLKIRDAEINILNEALVKMKCEDEFLSYKPIITDPIDVKLGHYINRVPLGLRSKMNF